MSIIVKLIRLVFGHILLAVSYLFPRNQRIWCFGSKFNGNAKYLYIFMNENCRESYRSIWIGDKVEVGIIRLLHLEAYYRWSLKGVYYSLIGGVYVYNSYPSNINLFTMGGAKLVNLWHGVALKCIDRQILTGPTSKYYQSKGIINEIRYLNFRKHADLVLSTSPEMTDIFSEAFDVPPSRIIEGIYPRCCLFDKQKEEIRSFVRQYEGSAVSSLINRIISYDYIYVYMPTWRDSGDDFLRQCHFDFRRVNEVMSKHGRAMIIKMHPDSHLSFEADFSNIIVLDKDVDIYPILPFTNCLITDFSSIYFDYLLMDNKDIILFIPDYEEYIVSNRNLAYPYDEVMKGIKARNFDDLLNVLDMDTRNYDMPELSAVKNRFWSPTYTNMGQLVNAIAEKCS